MISSSYKQLGFGISVYFLSSLGGISIVKLLNYKYCFTSWMWFALLSRSTWIYSIGLNYYLQSTEATQLSFSNKQIRNYFGIAVALSIVELFNSVSMSILPGSLYMLLKGSDVGWSMILSWICLKNKQYSYRQIISALFIMIGILLVFVLDDNTNNFNNDDDDDIGSKQQQHQYSEEEGMVRVLEKTAAQPISIHKNNNSNLVFVASILCLSGAFLNSLVTVFTEALLKQTLADAEEEEARTMIMPSSGGNGSITITTKRRKQKPSKLLLSNAYSMWTSFLSFLLLSIPLLFSVTINNQQTYDGHQPYSQHQTPAVTSYYYYSNNTTEKVNVPPLNISIIGRNGSFVMGNSSNNHDDLDGSNNNNCSNNYYVASDTDSNDATGEQSSSNRMTITTTIVVCLALLGLSRFLERLCKHFICVCDSAVTFSIVQAARRVLGVYIIGWLFDEPFSNGFWIGSICSSIGFCFKFVFRNDNSNNHVDKGTTNNNAAAAVTKSTIPPPPPLMHFEEEEEEDNQEIEDDWKMQEYIEMSPLVTQSKA